LLLHPGVAERVEAGEEGLLERCALESTRLGQRSIMLRAVLKPVEVHDGTTTWSVDPGAAIATFLPLTNTSAMPGLEGYDPDRWQRRRLRDEDRLAARELVTTFGHGRHTCPAMAFSLAAMTRSVSRLLATYELTPAFAGAAPLAGPIGGGGVGGGGRGGAPLPRALRLPSRRLITAPLQGRVVAIPVAVGDAVRASQPVVVIESMKMEHVAAADPEGVAR